MRDIQYLVASQALDELNTHVAICDAESIFLGRIGSTKTVPAIDNAVRRIVLMLSPFAPFTSDLAMDYDVIEIRRVWTFDTAVRLVYGGH